MGWLHALSPSDPQPAKICIPRVNGKTQAREFYLCAEHASVLHNWLHVCPLQCKSQQWAHPSLDLKDMETCLFPGWDPRPKTENTAPDTHVRTELPQQLDSHRSDPALREGHSRSPRPEAPIPNLRFYQTGDTQLETHCIYSVTGCLPQPSHGVSNIRHVGKNIAGNLRRTDSRTAAIRSSISVRDAVALRQPRLLGASVRQQTASNTNRPVRATEPPHQAESKHTLLRSLWLEALRCALEVLPSLRTSIHANIIASQTNVDGANN